MFSNIIPMKDWSHAKTKLTTKNWKVSNFYMFDLEMSNTDNMSMVQEQKSAEHELKLTI